MKPQFCDVLYQRDCRVEATFIVALPGVDVWEDLHGAFYAFVFGSSGRHGVDWYWSCRGWTTENDIYHGVQIYARGAEHLATPEVVKPLIEFLKTHQILTS